MMISKRCFGFVCLFEEKSVVNYSGSRRECNPGRWKLGGERMGEKAVIKVVIKAVITVRSEESRGDL